MFCSPYFLDHKMYGTQHFLVHKIFISKFFWDQNFFETPIFFGTLPIRPISTQLIIPNHPNMTNLTDKPDPTLFWTQIFSGSKFFRDPNFIWTLFFWDPIFVGTQICFGPKFFHYKSTQPDQLDQPNRPT